MKETIDIVPGTILEYRRPYPVTWKKHDTVKFLRVTNTFLHDHSQLGLPPYALFSVGAKSEKAIKATTLSGLAPDYESSALSGGKLRLPRLIEEFGGIGRFQPTFLTSILMVLAADNPALDGYLFRNFAGDVVRPYQKS